MSKAISKKQRLLYVAGQGRRCPHCLSETIALSDRFEHEAGTINVDAVCGGCNEEWVEIYALTSISRKKTS